MAGIQTGRELCLCATQKIPRTLLVKYVETHDDTACDIHSFSEWMIRRLHTLRTVDERLSPRAPHTAPQTTTGALVAHTTRPPSRPTQRQASKSRKTHKSPTKPCVFCKSKHFHEDCSVYTDCHFRQQFLQDKYRCLLCFSSDHQTQQCHRNIKCYHCQSQQHNRALCPRKFPAPRAPTRHTAATPVLPSATTMAVAAAPPLLERYATVDLPSTAPAEAGNPAEVHTLLTNGESVLLQTALAYVSSPSGNVRPQKVRLLLDSGSHRTFISKSCANTLHLKSEEDVPLSVYSFGAHQPKTIESSVVTFHLHLKDGGTKPITASAVPHVTADIHRRPVSQQDKAVLASLPDSDFADPLPSHQEAAVIDILLGSDYFWDIIGEGRQTLPSGLTMVQTKLGFVLSGRYQDPVADSRQHALHVCYVSTMTQQSTLTALDSSCTSFTPLQTPDIADFW